MLKEQNTLKTTHQPTHRKVKRFMLIFTSLLLAGILILTGILWSISPGKMKPFLDQYGNPVPDSISEKIFVNINGVEQGMFIKGKNIHNPVLLFVHGGPGMPEYWLTQSFPTGLEEDFTVVWWDQRGAGLSFNKDINPETMTVDQFIADTITVTNYLRERFQKEKIYLLGHSWGSYIGIQAAERAPELYHAYIGMGQISHQIKSEQLAYGYALEYYASMGDERMLNKLEAAPPTLTVPLPAAYDRLRDAYMHKAGIGTTRDMDSVLSGIFLPTWQFREYTLGEKINLWRGKIFSRSAQFGLWETLQNTDLTQEVPELQIPVYFLEGRYDYTCAYPLALDYFKEIKAPLKGFYTFENSAHSPLFEEPDTAGKIFREDILNGSINLADKE